MSNNTSETVLTVWQNFKLGLILQGIVVGLFAGLIVVLYRFGLETAGELSQIIYAYLRSHLLMIPLLGVVSDCRRIGHRVHR